jgi:hypothetical protein
MTTGTVSTVRQYQKYTLRQTEECINTHSSYAPKFSIILENSCFPRCSPIPARSTLRKQTRNCCTATSKVTNFSGSCAHYLYNSNISKAYCNTAYHMHSQAGKTMERTNNVWVSLWKFTVLVFN